MTAVNGTPSGEGQFQEELGVVNVHLASGEDVVGNVTVLPTGQFVISKPCAPQVTLNPDTRQINVGLMPLRPYLVNEPVVFNPEHVTFVARVTPQMEAEYTRFTTGLVIPTPNDTQKVSLIGR